MYINDEIRIFIKMMINTNRWKYGQKIPSEHDLAKQFFCSRLTIRNAYKVLVQEHLLKSIHGQGYFVSKQVSKKEFVKFPNTKTKTEMSNNVKPLPTTEVDFYNQLNLSKTQSSDDFTNYRKKYFSCNYDGHEGTIVGSEVYQIVDGYVIPEVAKKLSTKKMNESVAFSYWEVKQIMNHRKRIITVRKLTKDEQRKFNIVSDELFAVTRSALFNAKDELIEYSVTFTRNDKAIIYCDQELS